MFIIIYFYTFTLFRPHISVTCFYFGELSSTGGKRSLWEEKAFPVTVTSEEVTMKTLII